MARKQLGIIAAIGLTSVSFVMTALKSGKNDVAFSAEISGVFGAGTQTHVVADEAGKVRTFKDADDFLKQAGALGLVPMHPFDLNIVDDVAAFQPKAFTGDIVKKNQSVVVAYEKRKTDAQARSAALGIEIALREADPSTPPAFLAEKVEQKTSIDALVVWLTAEITRINGILAG